MKRNTYNNGRCNIDRFLFEYTKYFIYAYADIPYEYAFKLSVKQYKRFYTKQSKKYKVSTLNV